MRAQDVLRTKGDRVVTIGGDATVAEALGLLAAEGIGAVVVSPDGREVAGILSERDIVRALAERGAAVLHEAITAVMTSGVLTCAPSTTVDTLMSLMTEHRVRHVPVVVDGGLAGLVSIGDVVKSRVGELEVDLESIQEYMWHGR